MLTGRSPRHLNVRDNECIHPIKPYWVWCIACGVLVLFLTMSDLMLGQDALLENHSSPQIDWLEPRGLNIVDLVGLVPEDHLRDAILTYETGRGTLHYESGTRTGNTVEINVRVFPRYFVDNSVAFSKMGCLSQMAVYDHWPSAIPASKVRIFDTNGADITAQAVVIAITPSGQIPPTGNASAYPRYTEQAPVSVTFAADGSIVVPANMGCLIILQGRYNNFRARFTFEVTQKIQVTPLGSESFTYHSYIGAGSSGSLASLNSQMQKRYGNRHEKFTLTSPDGTDYIFVKYPPTPIDPYAGSDATAYSLPGTGTYRIGRSDNSLSIDHVNSMGLPLYGQWQDADQSGETYLPFFSDGGRLGAPEMFLPAGVPYEPCMTNGGCSSSLLEQVHTTAMNITVYYYHVDRLVNDLTRIPLRQVGRSWRPGQNQAQASALMDIDTATIPNCEAGNCVYLPVIHAPPPTPTAQPTPIPTATPNVPPDDPTGCPCGWFDGEGRMYDYIAPP